ncbi:hypothetical protein L345_11183, partial [Ophiophagus hannah]
MGYHLELLAPHFPYGSPRGLISKHLPSDITLSSSDTCLLVFLLQPQRTINGSPPSKAVCQPRSVPLFPQVSRFLRSMSEGRPMEDTKKTRNGLKCPGCFSMNLECQATEMLNCHDQERKCVYMAVTVQHDNQIYVHAKRGCGTKQACWNKERTFGIPGLYAEIWKNVTCSHAAK